MNERRKEEDEGAADAADIGQRSALESGVLRKGLLEELETPPPWQVIRSYLLKGEHRDWVEGHAARSPAFRDVLEALRNDEDDRRYKRRSSVVVPIKR